MKLVYRVVNFRYMKQYGIIRALRFSRTFRDIFDALAYISRQSDWYDLRVIAESDEKWKEEDLSPIL